MHTAIFCKTGFTDLVDFIVVWDSAANNSLLRNNQFHFQDAGRRMSLLKNGVFWVVTPCGFCKNRRFGGTWRLLHQGDKNR
jgi:hypothetical protein